MERSNEVTDGKCFTLWKLDHVVGISEMHECVTEIVTQTHIEIIYLSDKERRRGSSKLVTNSRNTSSGFLNMGGTWEEGLDDVPS